MPGTTRPSRRWFRCNHRCRCSERNQANPLRGPGCRASHQAAVKGPERLDPVGLPSLSQHGQAGYAGGPDEGGPSRGRGSRALMSVAGTQPTVPLDDLARCSRTALRFTALRFASCAAHVPDRHPGHPPCPKPGRLNAKRARAGSTGAPVASLGGTSAAEAPTLVTVCGPIAAAVAPVEPTAIPPTAPPSPVRGTCGGIFNAVGRETGSPFRMLATA